jgi:hypothetical protein
MKRSAAKVKPSSTSSAEPSLPARLKRKRSRKNLPPAVPEHMYIVMKRPAIEIVGSVEKENKATREAAKALAALPTEVVALNDLCVLLLLLLFGIVLFVCINQPSAESVVCCSLLGQGPFACLLDP